MKYGVAVPYENIHTVIELAVAAEHAEWDAFFVGDGIATLDAWVTLAAIAARTNRIKLGPMLTPVSRRRPAKLAAETATLDQLSGGRVILVVGLGSLTGYKQFGEATDRKVRAQMLDEGLEIVMRLWSGKPFDYAGNYFTVQQMEQMHPKPVQIPRIPVWVIGAWPFKKSVERALHWDGWVPTKSSGPVNPDDVRLMVEFAHEHRESDTPFDIVVEGVSTLGDTAQAADEVHPFVEAGATWWIESLWEHGRVDGYLRRRIEQGPPATHRTST